MSAARRIASYHEHAAIIDRNTFDQVQLLLKSKSAERKTRRAAGEALLLGKLYDDRGKRMSPSYSTKNGIRYRFYVSSALLRGRKDAAGSVARIAAAEIEGAILDALKPYGQADSAADASALIGLLERAVVGRTRLRITLAGAHTPLQQIAIPWAPEQKGAKPMIEESGSSNDGRNESLIQSVVRAHAWMVLLQDGTYGSVKDLADASNVHPKVVRQNLRLAFLSPEITSVILEGSQPANLALAGIPKLLSLKWTDHRSLLG